MDAAGNAVAYDDYDPWGMLMDGRSYNAAQADARYKFTSKERDTETGLDYFGARYYDSRIGRWGQVDAMSPLHPDYSPYAYVYNNPSCLIDPFGLDTTLIHHPYGDYFVSDPVTSWGSRKTAVGSSGGGSGGDSRASSNDGTTENGGRQTSGGLKNVTQKFDQRLRNTRAQMKAKQIELNVMVPNLFVRRLMTLVYFFNQVKTRGPLDIKEPGMGFSRAEIGSRAIYDNTVYNYDAFGNMNYGVAARSLGIPLSTAIAGAGLYQTFGQWSPDLSNPSGWFDGSDDTPMIISGYDDLDP